MSDDQLVPLFMPALSVLLVSAEDTKGAPLLEDEVLAIRDAASVIMVTKAHFDSMSEQRGYTDTDPENCWYDWQMLRREMGRKPDLDPGARVSYFSKGDDGFEATVVDAQNTLAHFRGLLAEAAPGSCFPLVKTLLAEPDYQAYIWLTVISHDAAGFVGQIFELPHEFKEYRIGTRIEVLNGAIKDWMINDQGTLFGGFSLRYARSRMSATEQAAFDRHVGVSTYA